MQRLVRSLRVLWRSERLLAEHELRLGAQRIQLNALAALVAVFGLVMLSVAAFYALVPYLGEALAALVVAGADFLLAGALIAYARSLEAPPEVGMVREMRDIAMSDIDAEAARVEADLVSMKNDLQKLIRNPMDALLPSAIGPLVGAVARGLKSAKE